MDFFGTKEDIFQIKNIGNNTAKNIILAGDWITFSFNNFDLNSGESKNIGYIIKPTGIIQTNHTNQTYEKNITISGNFETISKELTVFIKHSIITSGGGGGSIIEQIISQLKQYCSDNPTDVQLCPQTGVNLPKNETLSPADILAKAIFSFIDSQGVKDNVNKEQLDDISTKVGSFENKTGNVEDRLNSIEEKWGSSYNAMIFLSV